MARQPPWPVWSGRITPWQKKKKKLMGFGVAHWGGRTALMGHEGGSATLPSSFFLFFNFFLFYYF
jgi:hypothetical protein